MEPHYTVCLFTHGWLLAAFEHVDSTCLQGDRWRRPSARSQTHVSGQTHFSYSHRLIYLPESPRSRSPGWCWTGCLTQRLSTSCSSLGSPTPPETGYYLILKPVMAPRRAGMCVSGQAELVPWSLYWFWFPQNVIVCDSSLSVWLTGEVWSSPARRRPSPSPMAPATAATPPLSSTATW